MGADCSKVARSSCLAAGCVEVAVCACCTKAALVQLCNPWQTPVAQLLVSLCNSSDSVHEPMVLAKDGPTCI